MLCTKSPKVTVLARLGYASPAWWGRLSEADLRRLIRRAQRGGFLPDDAPTFEVHVRLSELMQPSSETYR